MRDVTMRVPFCGRSASPSPPVARRAGRTFRLAIVLVAVTVGCGFGLMAPSAGHAGEVLEFSGPGCLACQRMSPMVEKLKRQGYPIRVLDIRRVPRLARQLSVNLLPTFVLIEQGRAVKKIVGVTSEQRLRALAAAALASSRRSSSKSDSESDPGPTPVGTPGRAVPACPAGSNSPVVRANRWIGHRVGFGAGAAVELCPPEARAGRRSRVRFGHDHRQPTRSQHCPDLWSPVPELPSAGEDGEAGWRDGAGRAVDCRRVRRPPLDLVFRPPAGP